MPVLPHDESLHAVPVTYVSYSEAAAYCAHYGKRLPATWEWQYAAVLGRHQTNTNAPPTLHIQRYIIRAPCI